jgi:hypothetical protein
MAVGPHKIEYEVIKGWEQMPDAGVSLKSRVSRAIQRTTSTCSIAASIR